MAVDSQSMVNLQLFSRNGAIGRLAASLVMKVLERERELAYAGIAILQN